MTHLDKHVPVRGVLRNAFRACLLAELWLAIILSPSFAQSTRALWGYEPELASSPQEAITSLQELGANAVFMNNVTPQLLQALRAANIKVYTSLNVFGDNSTWARYPPSPTSTSYRAKSDATST